MTTTSDLNTSLAFEKEAYVKKLKRNLDRWRELVLFLHSVLLWKKPAYPWCILAGITFLFIEIAYYDLSLVTIVSLFLLIVTLIDFIAPLVANTLCKEEWTASKQKELEDVCKILAAFVVSARVYYASLLQVKATRPNLYYPVTLATFCLLAYVGNAVNNLFISYAFVLIVVMSPGLINVGVLQKYYKSLVSRDMDFLKNFNKPKTQ